MNKPENAESPIKLLRTAKGKRPQYFSDPDVDRLLAIIVPLIGEVSVLRDRLDTIERLVEKHGLFPQQEIEKFVASADEQKIRDHCHCCPRALPSHLRLLTYPSGVCGDEVERNRCRPK